MSFPLVEQSFCRSGTFPVRSTPPVPGGVLSFLPGIRLQAICLAIKGMAVLPEAYSLLFYSKFLPIPFSVLHITGRLPPVATENSDAWTTDTQQVLTGLPL